jgi:hypothetical protein
MHSFLLRLVLAPALLAGLIAPGCFHFWIDDLVFVE